jgi:hypothetical protein
MEDRTKSGRMAIDNAIVRVIAIGEESRILTLIAVLQRDHRVYGVLIESVRPRRFWLPGVRAELNVAVAATGGAL